MKSKIHIHSVKRVGQRSTYLSSGTCCAEKLVPAADKRVQIPKYEVWLTKLILLIIVLLPVMCLFFKTPVSALADKSTVTGIPTETDHSSIFVDTIDLKCHALMSLSDPEYGATQGMCVVDNRYIVIGRYKNDGAKDLMVYDVIDKKVKASNVFFKYDPKTPDAGTNVDLGHINGLTYYDGYFYIPRTKHRDIIRLKMNEDFSIVFDSVVFSAPKGEPVPANISCHDGVFYWLAYGPYNGKFTVCCSKNDFHNTQRAFESDIGGLATDNLLAHQGMTFDGEHLYFAFSGRLNIPSIDTGTDWQKLVRNTEKIIITTLEGKIIKTFTFSRGSYGEIEDVDTIQLGSSTYLIISCNQNDDGVACVYAVPLFQDTTPSGYLEASNMDGSFYMDRREFTVYCDNTVCFENGSYNPMNSNPFASGLTQDRFTSVYAALNYIKRLGCPAKLYLTGEYGALTFNNLPAGIGFVLDDAVVDSLNFTQCPGVTLEGQNKAVLGGLKAEKSVILAASGVSLIRTESSPAYGIQAQYSVLTGSFSGINGFTDKIHEVQSIVNISYYDKDKNARIEISPAGENIGEAEEDKTSVVQLSYYNQQIVSVMAKHDKNVMLTLTLHDVDPGETNKAEYTGIIPKEYRPAADAVFPAVVAGSQTGDDPSGMCSLHISADGTITVYVGTEPVKPTDYILATANYLVA